MDEKFNHEEGFTLIELLVVILIIGILSAIAIPAFLNQRAAATEVSLKSDLKNVGTLLEGKGKFTGSLPAGHKSSPGVQLTAMRTAERNNKVTSSQFVNSNDSGWGTFIHPSAPATEASQIIAGSADSYQNMNYRRMTIQTGSSPSAGHIVGFALPEVGKQGDVYSVGAAIRHNYTGCRKIYVEFKNAMNSWPGGISNTDVCFQKDEWKYVEAKGTANGDGATLIHFSLYGAMSTGQNADVTGAVVVKGSEINAAAALDSTGYDFCVQGYHESDKTNIWRYSSLDGGLQKKTC